MKKKIFMIVLACVMLVMCSIQCFALAEACSHNNGTAKGLLDHEGRGEGCLADETYYCDKCGEIFYNAYDVFYTYCPQWHKDILNRQ